MSKIYDPLGLVSPVVFYGKRFLQKLWFFGMEWDDCLLSPLCEEWEELIQIFQPLPQLRIPRFVSSNDEGTIFQIVTFYDASANSYAAAVYLRVVNQKSIQVNLLFSKIRLALRMWFEKEETSSPTIEFSKTGTIGCCDLDLPCLLLRS